jgi:hypothetical protein
VSASNRAVLAKPQACRAPKGGARIKRMRHVWPLGLLVGLVVAGCTGSSTTATTITTGTTIPRGARVLRYTMPAHAGGSRCAVRFSGHRTIAVFMSASLEVRPACAALIDAGGASGERWVFAVPPPASGPASEGDSQVCSLTDHGRASAVVFDADGKFNGRTVCTSLISVGWTRQSFR